MQAVSHEPEASLQAVTAMAERRQQAGLCRSQAASTPDPKSLQPYRWALTSCLLQSECLALLYPPSPLLLCPLASPPDQSCSDSPLCISALPKPLYFYFLPKPALAAFPSLASSTHFINMLFTSACRSLATILNNWQFAQEVAISGFDGLFYFPFRRAAKAVKMGGHGGPEPRAEMREAVCSPVPVNLLLCFLNSSIRSSSHGHLTCLFVDLLPEISTPHPFSPLKPLVLESMSLYLVLNFRAIFFQTPYITNPSCFPAKS